MTQPRIVAAAASRFKLAEHQRNTFWFTAEAGTTIEQITNPAFWAHIASKLSPLDRIEVVTDDYSLFTEVIVLDRGNNWAKVAVIREPMNLSGGSDISEIEQAESPYEIKFTGPHTKHRVIRKSDKSTLKEGFATKAEAEKWLTDYRRSVAA